MKSCSWCGKENEEEAVYCVGCGTEFKAEELNPLSATRIGPELPYPIRQCVLAFFAILAYYVFIAFSFGAVIRYVTRLGFPNLWIPIGVAVGLLQMLVAYLIIPASFYFLAFLSLILKEDDFELRKHYLKSAIVRSLFLAFVTPLFLLMLFAVVQLLVAGS
ncbi:MAG TPA: zinc-ribbon domain-containing protein [Candidatus Saccharimonadales bacterium]|nr:zinc-ribbon domain-containing protein [Candidatus Saccharimonadales bacterium]